MNCSNLTVVSRILGALCPSASKFNIGHRRGCCWRPPDSMVEPLAQKYQVTKQTEVCTLGKAVIGVQGDSVHIILRVVRKVRKVGRIPVCAVLKGLSLAPVHAPDDIADLLFVMKLRVIFLVYRININT